MVTTLHEFVTNAGRQITVGGIESPTLAREIAEEYLRMVGSSGSYHAIAGGKKMKGKKGKPKPIMHGQQKVSPVGIATGSAVRKGKVSR